MKTLISSAAAMLLLTTVAVVAGPGGVKDCADCGTVRAIETVHGDGKSHGGGAVIGAVIGGVIGHQFGNGRGNDAATAAGAVGGAVVGNEVEKNRNEDTIYRVTVQMEGGGTRQIMVRDLNGLAISDKVRVSGENLEKLG